MDGGNDLVSSWKLCGGTWVTEPHVVTPDPDRLALFTVGTDHSAYIRWRHGAEWGEWESLGGSFIATPFALSRAADRLDAFGVSHEHSILRNTYDGQRWSGWQPLQGQAGGATIMSVRAVSWAPDRLDVFVHGTDMSVYHKWQNGGRWSSWRRRGHMMISSPHVAAVRRGRLDVLAVGVDSRLYHATFQDDAWMGWQSTTDESFTAYSLPRLLVDDNEQLHAFVLGEGRAVYYQSWTGEWSNPVSLEGTAVRAPTGVASAAGLNVFVVGEDSTVWQRSHR